MTVEKGTCDMWIVPSMGDFSDVMENHWGGSFCCTGCGNFKSTSIVRLLEIVIFQYLKPGSVRLDFFFLSFVS